MTIQNPKVLLISCVNWDSMKAIPSLLEKAGCSVDIFCPENSWVLFNNCYQKWIPGNNNPQIFVDELLTYLESQLHVYYWIIPGDDIIIRLLNRKIERPDLFHKILPLTKIEYRALLGSKAGLSSLCEQFGIRTPPYLVYEDGISVHDIAEKVGFPMLLKLDESEGGYGIYKCSSLSELTDTLSTITNKRNLVIQHMIKGRDVNTDSLFRNGELIVVNTSLRMRTMGRFGVSTQRLFYDNPELTAMLQHIGRCFGLSGFGNIVFIQEEESGDYYLIEIDLRPNSWMYYGHFTGNDFAKGIAQMLRGNLALLPTAAVFKEKKTVVTLYKKDIYRCIIEKDFKEALNWLINKEGRWKYIPHHDRRLKKSVDAYLVTTLKDAVKNKFSRKKLP